MKVEVLPALLETMLTPFSPTVSPEPRPFWLAQAPAPTPAPTFGRSWMGSPFWFGSTVLLAIALVSSLLYSLRLAKEREKDIKFQEYKSENLNKRLKLALETIQKMERNPDLVYSREFNLDYLRLRMEEKLFSNIINNQIKVCIKQLVSQALRENTAEHTSVGIGSTGGRHIDRIFDIIYETNSRGKRSKGVLFRVRIQLTKMPVQTTTATVDGIIRCIARFLHPDREAQQAWQPSLFGKLVEIHWDQQARPTPMLVFEQTAEGVHSSDNALQRSEQRHPTRA